MPKRPSDADYELLLALRTELRRFLRRSDELAGEQNLTPAHHQLLLAIRGHPDPEGPTVGEVADYLLLRHHSAVGLVDRAEQAGLVQRHPDPNNYKAVRLRLTETAAAKLEALAEAHLDELGQLAPTMEALLGALDARRPAAT